MESQSEELTEVLEKYSNKEFMKNLLFSDYFPKFSSEIDGVINDLRDKNPRWIYCKMVEVIEEHFSTEIDQFKDYWDELRQYQDGCIGTHSVLVYYCTKRDGRFIDDCNNVEKNILEWAALFHDISKRGPPMFDSKDFTHPFRSGSTILTILKDCFGYILIEASQEPLWEEMIEFIDNSYELATKEEFPNIYYHHDGCQELHDHSKLPGIFERLYYFFPKNSAIVKIFKLIFFHQSLNGVREFPNTRILTDEEVGEYLTVDELYMLKIIMNNDSFSYSLPRPDRKLGEKRRKQVNQEIQRLVGIVEKYTK